MSSNSSSSNASLHPLPRTSNFHQLLSSCMNSTVGVFNVTAFTIINILLLLPLCISVLYLGVQRWRQQRSGTTMSHSDLFTYNMVILELLSALGSILTCCGVHADLPEMVMLGINLWLLNFYEQVAFHILTCVERHLAVVHPVTYLDLKKAKWIRFRTITVGCVWLLGFAWIGFMTVADYTLTNIVSLCYVSFAIISICFCSVSVLCVLIRPGPGDGGGDRQRVDQSKLRAFYTIMAILGGLVLRFGINIISTAVVDSSQLGQTEICGVWLSMFWFSLPSRLVLPLLFLHRAEKLPCCRNSNTTGQ